MQIASPKVSIGVAVYNQAPFIKDCLNSIKNQTYDNIEILIADDASTDNSVEIIKEYQKSNPDFFIKVILHKNNIGIAKNLNSLLNQTNGQYICIFAGDDLMHSSKISKQVAALENNPDASFCYTNMVWQNNDGKKGNMNHFGLLRPHPQNIYDLIADNVLPSPTFLLNRPFIPEYGFDEDIAIINDYKMALDLFEKAPPIYVNEVLTIYNKHENSLTAKNYYVHDRFKLYTKLKNKYAGSKNILCQKSLKKHKALCAYALTMTLIQKGNKKKSLEIFLKTIHYYFYSPKWLFRLLKVLLAFCKSLTK